MVSDRNVSIPDWRRMMRRASRSEPLSQCTIATCVERGETLAFDPTQNAWLRLNDAERPDEERTALGSAHLPRLPSAHECEILSLRYRLRPWQEADAGHYRILLDNPQVWQYLPENYPAPLTEVLARELITLSNAAGHHTVRAVERDGKLVGQVRLAFVPGDAKRHSGEISYWLGRDWWGRGIATDAVILFIWKLLSAHPELLSVFARVHRNNAASARLLGRIGFDAEGSAANDPQINLFRLGRRRLKFGG